MAFYMCSVNRKVSKCANIVRQSQHMIAFTGAGISTRYSLYNITQDLADLSSLD